jgi:succinate dehydrogenase / fumarate reductase cytochrome b subunit
VALDQSTRVKADPSLPAGRRAPTLWQSTIGKKAVMAVTGLLMLAFLVVHMLGNLKIFFGATEFDDYAEWLRTIGEPVLHEAWFLWAQRAVLLAALVLHVVAAAQLSRRDRAARPTRYAHGQRRQASFATWTMRWGGVTLALFIVWHILDLTVGAVNPDYIAGRPYHNIVADFSVWWINVIYIVAMVMVGLHVHHGFWSASRTLGLRPGSSAALRTTGTALALVLTVGFLAVPVGVMTGLVS